MAETNIFNISGEVLSLLREGGKRCESFLEKVAEDEKLIKAFCKHHNSRLTDVYVIGTSSSQPFYSFSNSLGLYNSSALKASLK